MKNLYLICLLFIISACGTPTTEERITFTQGGFYQFHFLFLA